MPCYCGSNNEFVECCEPYHLNITQPDTAEQLMRARYSAYAVNNAEFIFNTYAKISQRTQSVAEIEQWAKQCKWLRLQVITHKNNVNTNDPYQAIVEFIAHYLLNDQYYQMHEVSRFSIEDSCWKYLDGDIIKHELISSIKRNDPCPCLSGKKFKQCCR